eukprot:5167718-Lingulodinium_polyedra.AAC.1
MTHTSRAESLPFKRRSRSRSANSWLAARRVGTSAVSSSEDWSESQNCTAGSNSSNACGSDSNACNMAPYKPESQKPTDGSASAAAAAAAAACMWLGFKCMQHGTTKEVGWAEHAVVIVVVR